MRRNYEKVIPEIRETVSTFIDAPIDEIALIPNFSYGLSAVIPSIASLKRVLLFKDDYPSLVEPFLINDFVVHWIESTDEFSIDMEEMKQSIINNNIKIDFEEKKIKLPKIKTRIVYRDKRTFDEQIRQVTVSKTKSGEYYVSILVEQEREVKIKTEIKEEKIQAFDMSFLKFLVATENEYQNPRFYRNEEKRLQRLHRRLSRKEKGSKNRTKARIDLARKYQQIKDRKKDWTHKLTHELSKEYDAIILENLNIEGMKQFNKGHAKTVTLDFSWGQFVRVLRYKMAQQGKHLVLVDRFFPSSKLCSNCDCKYDDLKLSERKWTCQECGVEHDRDRNAAKNLLKEGITILQSLGIMIKSTSGTRKVTPVEMMSDATRGAIVDEAGIHPL